MAPPRQSDSGPLAFVAPMVGGAAFSFTLLAILNLVAWHAMHHTHGVWAAVCGGASAIFGYVVVAGLWR